MIKYVCAIFYYFEYNFQESYFTLKCGQILRILHVNDLYWQIGKTQGFVKPIIVTHTNNLSKSLKTGCQSETKHLIALCIPMRKRYLYKNCISYCENHNRGATRILEQLCIDHLLQLIHTFNCRHACCLLCRYNDDD